MERKTGEIFEYNSEWYQCVESACNKECYFYNKSLHKTIADINGNGFGACNACFRNDNKSVIFKKLEKIGGTYAHNSVIVQKYRIRATPVIMPNEPYMYFNAIDNTIEIEIKQTKEDMEEKKLNLKPFDIQKAREGKPVCTRDGRKARIICFDKKDNQCPIVALVDYYDRKDGESVTTYTNEGFFCIDKKHPNDLMMCPLKHIGYINIYDNNRVCKQIFETEGEAKIAGNSTPDKYIQTIKIEWEE